MSGTPSFSTGRRTIVRLGVLSPLVMIAGCSAGGPAMPDLPIDSASTAGYRLGHGDRVLVAVYGQQELTGEHTIDGAGNIAMPLIGTVQAGGGTSADLEVAIAERLSPEYLNDPKVTVQMLAYRPFYIIGEVKDPGSYQYVDGMVVMNAVALASGFTYRAREDEFYITRDIDPDRRRRIANPNSPVLPGDLITVRERYF